MKGTAGAARRGFALLLCGLCAIAFVPAALGAYFATGWLDLDPPAMWSAFAMVALPFPLALGAVFAWKAAATARPAPLLAGAACALIAIALGAIVWAWGGRMLA